MVMAISSAIRRLRENNEGFKQLILTADEISLRGNNDQGQEDLRHSSRASGANIPELIEAILGNYTVQSVFLDHFFAVNLEADDICRLFDALGSLPKLNQFSVLSREAEGWSVPLHAIASFLHRTKRLTSLRMSSIGLNGTGEEFDYLTKVIQDQTLLKEFCLRGACIVDGEIPVDKLLRVLSSLPLLEKIELTAMDLHTNLQGVWPTRPSSALRFCYSSSLKSLELGGWVLDEDLVVEMAKALETNTSLRSLVMLDNHITDKGCMALAKTLTVNQTIERLDLSSNHITDTGCQALANSLASNRSLKEIGLFGKRQAHSRDAFLRVLRHENLDLEDLLLDSVWDAEMNFYLNLNRIGRHRLLKDPSFGRAQWVDCLNDLQSTKQSICDAPNDTLSNLFYFVMAKPHFVYNEISNTATAGE